ncbi:uncharacterized protein PAC_07940 [Phialocephala subalpina]|uniref:Uncharacterized protein n=1 Tax=Phialocephala subalpina TaxID=576137 RepID=A0A1L7WZ66_9HELO|nr:uncharacterized protein PAC_07940 [Phialocephala subalpina]
MSAGHHAYRVEFTPGKLRGTDPSRRERFLPRNTCVPVLLKYSGSPSLTMTLGHCDSGANGQWQVDYLLSHEMLSFGDTKFNSSITFSLSRGGSVLTNYSTNWINWPTPTIPKQWIKCEDPMLRFRIATFNDASNFTIEVVELEPVVSKSETTSLGVTRANISLSRTSGIYCFGNTQAAGTQCELSEPPLILTSSSSSFTPSPLNII